MSEQKFLDSEGIKYLWLKNHTEINNAKIEIIGKSVDDKSKDTIYAAKNFASNLVNECNDNLQKNYATKNYVEEEIATFDFIKVVDALPTTGLANRFYMVPKDDIQSQDLFDEYVWINKGTEDAPNWVWEWITTKQIEVDLTNYTTFDKVEELLLEKSKREHGIGSLYFSMSAVNPSEIFGFGEWELIAKNSFLIGAGDTYQVGETGGEATHTLTIDEMPSHTHTYQVTAWVNKTGDIVDHSNSEYIDYEIDRKTRATGGSQPHNNLPPYLAVYIWQRTA